MLEIEWKSSLYHSDGRPRSRPKASTVHGWLVKWRATFSGNEHRRKEGIREMREAKAVRERKRERATRRQARAGASEPKLLFCLGPISFRKRRRPQTPNGLSRLSRHSSVKPPSRKNTRQSTSPSHSPTPSNSRRSSHNHQGPSDRTPRKLSYNSQESTARVARKRR